LVFNSCKDSKIKGSNFKEYLNEECSSNINQFITISKYVLSENFRNFFDIISKFCESLIEF